MGLLDRAQVGAFWQAERETEGGYLVGGLALDEFQWFCRGCGNGGAEEVEVQKTVATYNGYDAKVFDWVQEGSHSFIYDMIFSQRAIEGGNLEF
jgi:hypothetical protein